MTTLSTPPGVAEAASAPALPTPRSASGDTEIRYSRIDVDALTVARRWHPPRWIATVAVLVLGAQFVHGLVTNETWDWPTFGEYILKDSILRALGLTLELTLYAVAIGFVAGIGIAAARLSRIPLLKAVSWVFIWAFRSIPLPVQILFWFNISVLYKTLSLGIPFGPSFLDFSVRSLFSPFTAAVIALSLHQAAYAAEIIRAGIISVEPGQTEAAASLGIPRRRQFFAIVLPQAMRAIVPNATNEVIGMVKATSLLAAVAVADLFYQVQVILGRNGRVIALLMVATVWYIAVSTVLTIVQFYVERYFARGSSRHLPPTPLQQLRTKIGHLVFLARQSRPGRARGAKVAS